ncbi:hypothetical protein F511_02430 [Dorcoceras hygrometricum]|nr:hypothetical protein F511_02430 [Dorcoceras hygrometricum]
MSLLNVLSNEKYLGIYRRAKGLFLQKVETAWISHLQRVIIKCGKCGKCFRVIIKLTIQPEQYERTSRVLCPREGVSKDELLLRMTCNHIRQSEDVGNVFDEPSQMLKSGARK